MKVRMVFSAVGRMALGFLLPASAKEETVMLEVTGMT